jgi:hypothetical protein
LDSSELECDASGKSSLTRTASECSPSTGQTCGDGMTLEPSRHLATTVLREPKITISNATDAVAGGKTGTPMSFVEASHARTSAQPARVQGCQDPGADSGGSSTVSSKRSGRSGRSLKTSQPFALADWIKCSGRSLRSGMIRNGTVYPLVPLARPTEGTESGLWPTPVANDDNKTPEAHMAMKARMKGGPRYKPTSLNVMVKGVERGLWPTPDSHCWKAGTRGNGTGGGQQLSNQLVAPSTPGQLNPTWVEWLMGFPLGWTDLDVSATQSCHRSQSGLAAA